MDCGPILNACSYSDGGMLDDLTRAGKIIYAGFSDFPAWRIARAVTVAELRSWADG
jgi:aryl-alcohol dehydrogenase-like predicted oxidoreductase